MARGENWEAIFGAHPDIQVTLTTRAQSGDEIWGSGSSRAKVLIPALGARKMLAAVC
jgi:hypothetical protein